MEIGDKEMDAGKSNNNADIDMREERYNAIKYWQSLLKTKDMVKTAIVALDALKSTPRGSDRFYDGINEAINLLDDKWDELNAEAAEVLRDVILNK